MLEEPDLPDEKIASCLQAEYDLQAVEVVFLPLGADRNTAVYRIITQDGAAYFLKLRQGDFNETSVTLPKFLSDRGIPQIIACLETQIGQLWTSLDRYKVLLYPFVEGHNGYEADLSDRHWIEFGTALKRIQSLEVPAAFTRRIRRETYSPQWRQIVKTFMARVKKETFAEPVAAKLAAFLNGKCDDVLDLVERTERLARELQPRSPKFVLCHSDIHAGNILMDANDDFYIVDWDDPILAPKERDLMYAGGGQFGTKRTPDEEETLLYRGYGQAQVDPSALAYYRYERIIEDIAAFCQQIFSTKEGGADREQAYRYLTSNFLPGGVLEIAYKSDRTQRKLKNSS
jgi:spectinomycin phosphotransferase